MWEPWMLRAFGVRPRDVRQFTMRELARMADDLKQVGGDADG